jgi:hypothetical protein
MRNAILGMMSDIERNEINNSNFIPTRTNTSDTLVDNNSNMVITRTNTSDTLANNNLHDVILRSIDNESLTELTDQNRISELSERNTRSLRRSSIISNSNLGLHYRSNSPASIIRSSSESLLSNVDSNLNNDID